MRLITDAAHPVAADRLLIVTFTRAAAEELRGRIAGTACGRGGRAPRECVPAPSAAAAGRANTLYHRRIQHASCSSAISRSWACRRIFELADDAKAYTLRQNALSAVLEELYEDADFCAFASLYGRARSDASALPRCWGCMIFSPHAAPSRSGAAKHLRSLRKRTPLGQTAWGRTLLENAGRAAQRTAPAGCGEGHRRAGAGACQLCTGAGQRRGVFRGAAGIHRRGPVGQCGCLYSRIQAACVAGLCADIRARNECGEGARRP